jgi:glycine cleavage system H protein
MTMAEQVWSGCVLPDDLLYDVGLNVWVRMEGDEAVLGMTDIAQSMGGRVVHVTWKRVGRQVERGQPVAVIESAKWVGPFPTPLTGELTAVNKEAFEQDHAVANRDPYGAGWMVRVRPSRLDDERSHLQSGPDAFPRFKDYITENDVRCYRCTD